MDKKSNIEYDLELEEMYKEKKIKKEFVPSEFIWLDLDEQKIKTDELENMGK